MINGLKTDRKEIIQDTNGFLKERNCSTKPNNQHDKISVQLTNIKISCEYLVSSSDSSHFILVLEF